jgi:hypothetical protein
VPRKFLVALSHLALASSVRRLQLRYTDTVSWRYKAPEAIPKINVKTTSEYSYGWNVAKNTNS